MGEEGLPIDLVILFLLYSPPRIRAIASLARARAKDGLLTPELVATTMAEHREAVRRHLPAVLELAEALQGREGGAPAVAAAIYTEAFRCLGPAGRQEVVANLVSRATYGGAGAARGAALGVLSSLVAEQGEEVATLAVFLTQLLDCLDRLELVEVRVVLQLLTTLAWGVPGGAGIRDQLVIVVKKQLNSYSEEVQKMGVVGAVAAAGAMLGAREEGELSLPLLESTRSSSAGPALPCHQAEALQLLLTARHRSARAPAVAALYCDALEKLVASAAHHKDFLDRLQGGADTSLAQEFESQYLPDTDVTRERSAVTFEVETRFVVEEAGQSESEEMEVEPAVVQLVALAAALHGLAGHADPQPDRRRVQDTVLAARMPAALRLLCRVTEAVKGGLEEVDGLSVCGLRLPAAQVAREMAMLRPEERQVVLSSLFLGHNWLVEVLNMFAGGEDKALLVVRLRQVLAVRGELRGALRHCQGYRPPPCAGADTAAWAPPTAKAPKGKAVGKGKKGVKRKRPTEQTLNATLHLTTQASQGAGRAVEAAVAAPPPPTDLEHYSPFLRRLELPTLLSILSSATLDIKAGQQGLHSPDLLHLLSELHSTLRLCLVPRRAFPGRGAAPTPDLGVTAEQAVLAVLPSLKYVSAHLDGIVKHFRELVEAMDGIQDSTAMFSTTSTLLASCMEEGLGVVHLLLASHHSSSHHPALLASLSPNTRFASSPPTSPAELGGHLLPHLATYTAAATTPAVAALHLAVVAQVEQLVASGTPAVTRQLAERYLAKDWRGEEGEREKGAKYAKQVQGMLVVYLGEGMVLDKVERLVEEGVAPVVGEGRESEAWPAVSRATLGPVFAALLAAIVTEARRLVWSSRWANPRSYLCAVSCVLPIVR